MSNTEQDPSSEVSKFRSFEAADEKATVAHQQELDMHAQQAESHRALKAHHFKMMTMTNMLYKETRDAN
jgi:hypothetical protein